MKKPHFPAPGLSLKFVLGCSLILAVALGVSFYVLARKQERLIMEQVEREARALFTQIVITRSWIADHGGVFVETLPWTKPSPYLPESEIVDLRGKKYTRKTPAMVTKDLSRYSKERGLYWFHITSLRLTNPENAPDDFERSSLEQFDQGAATERLAVERIGDAHYLRYIAPLSVEEACLSCHATQGYKVGDVRGAISVVVPVEKTLAEISANRVRMGIAAAVITLTLIGSMFFMMKVLVLTPLRRLKSSITEFSQDKRTTPALLRTGDEFEDLSHAFADMTRTLAQYHDSLNLRVQDATRSLEEANAQLTEANRLLSAANLRKSDFVARASHEIRTPLTSIKGAIDYLSTKLSALPSAVDRDACVHELQVFFEVIRKNTERLIRMVNDMLDIERIETGTSELSFNDIDLALIIEETVAYFQFSTADKSLSLGMSLVPGLRVRADDDRIRQVLINLLSNAMKFSPPGGSIVIESYARGNRAAVEVCDEGPGIAAEDRERIFAKFFRKGAGQGVGLGLAICKTIIEAHDGTIGVDSSGGSGARFFITLPLVAPPDLPSEHEEQTESGSAEAEGMTLQSRPAGMS
ncbi:MAG TPA: ATP-binding protein [Dissulfurispiraceae bacterium]|nr:ATP-binding protein [Dissulfurispiraceae bacterium]